MASDNVRINTRIRDALFIFVMDLLSGARVLKVDLKLLKKPGSLLVSRPTVATGFP